MPNSTSGRDETAWDAAIRYSRRQFIGRLISAATVIPVAGQVLTARVALAQVLPGPGLPPKTTSGPAFFGRIFANLPPFVASAGDPAVRAALLDIGKPGGLMDANDGNVQTLGPTAPQLLITNPTFNGNGNPSTTPPIPPTNPDNPAHTAGTTFMGQFLDHDMTFDFSSALGVPTDPTQTNNVRQPAFDLDSIYGGGYIATRQFYDPADPVKFLVGSGGIFEDLPRDVDRPDLFPTPTGNALIPDFRNDENLMIAGLHAAFLLFHNHAVDYARNVEKLSDPATVFAEARRLTTWHYQWMIVHEFLPLFVGQAMVDNVMTNGPLFYHIPLGKGFIPVEFQTGTYRMGHSMVRPSYRANLLGDPSGIFGGPFFGMIFDASQNGLPYGSDPSDLRGGFRAQRRFIGWQTFFDFGDGQVKRNKKIDHIVSSPLFNLPLGTIPATHPSTDVSPPVPHTVESPVITTSLPQRNLLRHVTWELPAGQSIAQTIANQGITLDILSAADLPELKGYGVGFETSTPMWYYNLKEAQITQSGQSLGQVGGRIVAEVFIGLLKADPFSYLHVLPDWTPELPPGPTTGTFRMVDFLTFAKVDPVSRHLQNPLYA